MMLNYVKYGLSEESEPKSRPQLEDVRRQAKCGDKLTRPPRTASTANSNIIQDVQEAPPYRMQYVWWNIVLLGGLHLAAVYGLCLRFEHFGANAFAKLIALLSTLGITGGAHRLWTHRSYKANWAAQVVLMCMATLTYQNSVYVWARDHRMHHKYAETDADPHNAKRGFFFCHMGWLMVRKHPAVIAKGHTIDMSDLRANPLVMFQHRYYYTLVVLIAVAFPACFAHYVLGASWEVAVYHVTIYRYIVSVNLVWCINSMAHLYGNKPYDRNIGPTESGMMRAFGFGEGFHNYHHTYPYDYKAAEFHNDARNLTTLMIDFFALLGWVTDRKTVSLDVINAKCARSGGGDREVDMYDPAKKTYRNIKSSLVIALLLIARYVVSVDTTLCVNGLAHLRGYKPYDTNIGPTENPLMKVIGMGEAFHNYHHTYPYDYRASEFGNDCCNLTTLLIDALAALGWVWARKTVPPAVVDRKVVKSGNAAVRDVHMAHGSGRKALWNTVYLGLVCSYVVLA